MKHLFLSIEPEKWDVPSLLNAWRDDTLTFLRHDAPKILLVLLGAIIVTRLLRFVVTRIAGLQVRKLPHGVRAQQVRTLAGVISSVGVYVIVFIATLEVLPMLGLNLGPLLASAGIAGLAIGFGAQTLVKDFINGFFILMENQYDIGDVIRVAGVKGAVESMSLRSTALRDDDGTVHTIPNSEIKIVSNMTRDWSQLTLRVTVSYSESSDKVLKLLQDIAADVRTDERFASDLVADIQVPGIDRVGNGEVEYLMLVKTRPNRQHDVGRELRRRIKAAFEENNIKPAGPGRVFVMDQSGSAA